MVDFDNHVPKGFRAGTHRLISPAETVAKVRGSMSTMGITRIANITGLDSIGIPVVQACHPNSRCLALSQGKGLDLNAAKASALMEAVESYHAERIDLPLKLGSYEDLRRNHSLVDTTRLPRTVDSAFDPHLSLLWIEGHDLMQGKLVWLPYEVVHTNYTLPAPTGSGCFLKSSNGLASGNHLLEAISHGISEVVEHDAKALWYLAGGEAQKHTRVDLNTVEDSNCRDVLEKYERAGVDVAVWETTSDVGIPSFICYINERTDDPWHLLYAAAGMGCHPLREIALLRALTEAAQSRLTVISGSRDDTGRDEYEAVRNIDALKRERARMETRGVTKSFEEGPSWDAETFNEDVDWQIERLRDAGLDQVVVVNLSKPELGIPVVRVVIPGLEFEITSPSQYQRPCVHSARAKAAKARRS